MKYLLKILLFFLLFLSTGCQPDLEFLPTPIPQEPPVEPTQASLLSLTQVTITHQVPSPTFPLKSPTALIETPTPPTSNPANNFSAILESPIPADFPQNVDASYLYGTTQNGLRIPHDGVEFYQPFGTPVLAAADGKVIFSGTDEINAWGRFTNFYGNLVIVQHSNLGNAPFYSLYGHLSSLAVKNGDTVRQGDLVGAIGASGGAFGSHLHFEVRLGGNELKHTANPLLFLQLLTDKNGQETGILLGNIRDNKGALVPSANLVLQKVVEGRIILEESLYQETYSKDIPSHPEWQENFVFANLTPGEYRISTFINQVLYEQFISLQTGQFINIQLKAED